MYVLTTSVIERKQQIMKKHISLILALILAALSLLSCSDKGNTETTPNETTAPTADSTQSEAESETEAEKTVTDTVREKYSSYNYDGYEYKVLAPGPGAHFGDQTGLTDISEVWTEETNGLRSTMQYSHAILQRKTCSA